MQYRRLGSTGMKVSSVSLGGWITFGGSIQDQKLAQSIIAKAYEIGINFFDIADAYATGMSETMMGKELSNFPRHTLVISSKLFWPMSDDVNDRGLSRKHIMESIEKSLKRIGTDYLDIYFCHRYDSATPLEEVVRAMDDLVHQGKILYWGTSEWTGAQIVDAVGLARSYNCYAPVVEQPGYNLLKRERVEGEILPAVRSYGIGLTVFSPLQNGILTGKYDDGIPQDSRATTNETTKGRVTDDAVRKVKELKSLADEIGVSRAQLALAWLLSHPEVSSVITGATKAGHVESNAKAADVNLSDDMKQRVESIFSLG